ncbi:MAG: 5,10-methylenetetrahydrofolate reductase [Candidatus Schekmanbacteria bacterium]|nr:MAG: 5,10-methylenetetrahydrofolate reductase [Candidatus Schekmanbacteria bacterium]
MKLTELFEKNTFVKTVELEPPKGTDTKIFLEKADSLKESVQFFNVTDQQSAVMRAGSLIGCSILKEKNLEPILQISCRDRNRIALQSDLLNAAILGIENVLVITGDHPYLGDHPDAKAVFDLDSVQLLQAIERLNNGEDMAGNKLEGNFSLCCGAVFTPSADNPELELIKIEKKIKAGAKFFQTQAIFDVESFNSIMNSVKDFNIPVMAGILILKSEKMANFMNRQIAGIKVPEEIIKRMEKAEDKRKEAVDIAVSIIDEVKDKCQGIHIMGLGWEDLIPEIIQKSSL